MDGDITASVLQATRLGPLASLARAATDGADQPDFLPLAAREAAQLLQADACELWLDEHGPVLAASHRVPDALTDSPTDGLLAEALAGETGEEDGWLAAPVFGSGAPIGVLAVYREGSWPPAELVLAHVAASLVGLAIATRSGGFGAEERNQFLALVGHDLRSPLANVKVAAQLAVRNLEAGDIVSVKSALGIIENQSGRLVQRLEALLEAVAAQGAQLIRLEPIDLADLAESTVAPYRLAAEESGAGTVFEVVAEDGAPLARGDSGQAAQVLQQLVDNASKYASGGRVSVRVSADGKMARVDVCDDGPGIRPEDIDRVFAPFGRGHAAAGRDGYGLGLYLARNIVSSHGGKLWVARTSRSGTCMAFTLPAYGTDDG